VVSVLKIMSEDRDESGRDSVEGGVPGKAWQSPRRHRSLVLAKDPCGVSARWNAT
jgi:hypothetical protein